MFQIPETFRCQDATKMNVRDYDSGDKFISLKGKILGDTVSELLDSYAAQLKSKMYLVAKHGKTCYNSNGSSPCTLVAIDTKVPWQDASYFYMVNTNQAFTSKNSPDSDSDGWINPIDVTKGNVELTNSGKISIRVITP